MCSPRRDYHSLMDDVPTTRERHSSGAFAAIAVVGLILLAVFLVHRYGVPGFHHKVRTHDQTIVPDVVGENYGVAFGQITAAGLCTRHVSYVASSSVPRDSVVQQTPQAGRTIPNLSGLDLIISSGPTATSPPGVLPLMDPRCP